MNNAQTPLTAVHTANAPAAIGPSQWFILLCHS